MVIYGFGEQIEVQRKLSDADLPKIRQDMAVAIVDAKAEADGTDILAVFDLAAIITIIATIIDVIQQCRSDAEPVILRARAKERGRSARGIKIGLRRAYRAKGHSRREAKAWACATFVAMTDADDDDIADVIAEAGAAS